MNKKINSENLISLLWMNDWLVPQSFIPDDDEKNNIEDDPVSEKYDDKY